jgi:hypothetical protein
MKTRNAIYAINELEPGDRFYYKGNKTKDVYEVKELLNNGAQVLAVRQPCLKEQEERCHWLFHKTTSGFTDVVFLRHNPESRYIV